METESAAVNRRELACTCLPRYLYNYIPGENFERTLTKYISNGRRCLSDREIPLERLDYIVPRDHNG